MWMNKYASSSIITNRLLQYIQKGSRTRAYHMYIVILATAQQTHPEVKLPNRVKLLHHPRTTRCQKRSTKVNPVAVGLLPPEEEVVSKTGKPPPNVGAHRRRSAGHLVWASSNAPKCPKHRPWTISPPVLEVVQAAHPQRPSQRPHTCYTGRMVPARSEPRTPPSQARNNRRIPSDGYLRRQIFPGRRVPGSSSGKNRPRRASSWLSNPSP